VCVIAPRLPRSRQRFWGAGILALALTGCASLPGRTPKELELGMSPAEVRAVLGPPQRVAVEPNMTLEMWYYRGQMLTFHQGILFSWEDASSPTPTQEGR